MSLEKPDALAVDGSDQRFLIVAARYNNEMVEAILASTREGLEAQGVKAADIDVLRVPGSYEVPFAIHLGLDTGQYDCCIGLGVLIRGETSHYEHIAQSVSDALQMVALNQGVPVINGVVVAETREQAQARSAGQINRGKEFAACALEMAALRKTRIKAYEQQ